MKPIRLLALLEANTVTGPAKNLLQFVCIAGCSQHGSEVETGIALFLRQGSDNHFADAARQLALPVYPIQEAGRFDQTVVSQLRSAIVEFGAGVIQTHSVKSHFLVRMAGLHRTTPWVAFHHGYTWPDLKMRLYNQLDRWSLPPASQIVTVSEPFRDELVARGTPRDRIEIVHNAIDPNWGAGGSPDDGRRLRASLGIGPEKKVVLIVGRLSREKDHQTLLRALHRLRTQAGGPPAHLLIVGDGPERERIQGLAHNLQMNREVTFTGQVPSAAPYYGISDLAVLSSLSEGSPNALLEAMATRTPVVATAVGGVPEIVSNGESAILVKPGECEPMARAIADVLGDEALRARLTTRAHELIVSNYSPLTRAQRLIGIYRKVLDRASG